MKRFCRTRRYLIILVAVQDIRATLKCRVSKFGVEEWQSFRLVLSDHHHYIYIPQLFVNQFLGCCCKTDLKVRASCSCQGTGGIPSACWKTQQAQSSSETETVAESGEEKGKSDRLTDRVGYVECGARVFTYSFVRTLLPPCFCTSAAAACVFQSVLISLTCLLH